MSPGLPCTLVPRLSAQQDRRWCYHCVRPLPPTPVRCGGHSHAQAPPASEASSGTSASLPPCDRLYCSSECASTAWDQYHAPLCGKDLARLEAYASKGVTTSACYILFTWKMLGLAIQRQRLRGRGAALESPADIPPFCQLARVSDVGNAAKLLEAGLGDYKGGVAGPLGQWLMIREILGPAFVREPALSVSRVRSSELLPCCYADVDSSTTVQLSWYVDATDMLAVNLTSVDTGTVEAAAVDAEAPPRPGAALMSGGTFFNHSCEPNLVMRSSMADMGGAVAFYAKRDIAAGTELTIAYTNDAPLELRQMQLRAQYGFECKCSKCLRESATSS